MTEPLEATEVGTVSTKAFDYGRTETLLQAKDVVALGPGLGGHPETVEFVRRLVSQTRLPLVLDADGINAFTGKMEIISGEDRTLVLTPHPGEFARLLGVSVESVRVNRIDLCRRFAQEHRVHLILKGHRTIYASPSGQLSVNSTGNPGMATGGSGDVLTGMLAAQPFNTRLFGDESLSHRPMRRVIEPLTEMGARVISEPSPVSAMASLMY